jgi:selenocysteine-specific elongation factor
MIIGTAGHIDHGKTTLLRALTGIDPDRLSEEKRRGMTIDLGFAYCAPGGGAADEPVLAYVDVPGHERFVHNMLAGVKERISRCSRVCGIGPSSAATASRTKSMPVLGIERGVVALTKSDLVPPERLAAVADELRELLAASPLAGVAIMPVSAVTGEGLVALAEHLTAVARRLGPRAVTGEFRLAIDRSFVMAGVGLVVTGTVAAGRVSIGERVLLTPCGVSARVRGIQVHNRSVPGSEAGQRCALNLAGPRLDRERVRRGEWVAAPSLFAPTSRLDAWLRLLPGVPAAGFKPGVGVQLHLGTGRVGARLVPLGDGPQPIGEPFPVRLVLKRPIAAWCGDRFILRDGAANRTIGGGVVLDPAPPARGGARPERLAALAAFGRPEPAAALTELLAISDAGVDLDRFAQGAGLTAGETEAAGRAAGAVVLRPPDHRYGFALSQLGFAALRAEISAALAAHHEASSESPGPTPEELRRAVAERLPRPVFRALVETLADQGALQIAGAALRLPGHAPALTPAAAHLWGKIRRRLDASGFEPCWVRDLARELDLSEAAMRQLMKRLARLGEVVEVAPDRFYRHRAVRRMAEIVTEMCRAAADGTLSAAAFRDRLGTGRKLAIIVLEFFDRCGLTLRRGDLRTIQPDRLGAFADSRH